MNITSIVSANNNGRTQHKPAFEAKFDRATIKYLDNRMGKTLRIQMQNVIKPLVVENTIYSQSKTTAQVKIKKIASQI